MRRPVVFARIATDDELIVVSSRLGGIESRDEAVSDYVKGDRSPIRQALFSPELHLLSRATNLLSAARKLRVLRTIVAVKI